LAISEALGEAHTRRQPMELTGKGSGSRYGDNAYVPPRLRGSMAAAGGSDGSSSRLMGEGSQRGKEGHGERKVKEVRLPASRIALVRPPACGIAPTAAAAAAAHSVPCIHSPPRSIADPWTTAGPWADRTMHIGGMPGDKTKTARAGPGHQGHYKLGRGMSQLGSGSVSLTYPMSAVAGYV
jgi:hypothetical protein